MGGWDWGSPRRAERVSTSRLFTQRRRDAETRRCGDAETRRRGEEGKGFARRARLRRSVWLTGRRKDMDRNRQLRWKTGQRAPPGQSLSAPLRLCVR